MHKNLFVSKLLLSRLRLSKIISTVDCCFRAGPFWVYGAFQIIAVRKILTLVTGNAMQTTDVLETIDTVNDDRGKNTDRQAPGNY
jgi:hypothetical protein